jgi:hypothetical protein
LLDLWHGKKVRSFKANLARRLSHDDQQVPIAQNCVLWEKSIFVEKARQFAINLRKTLHNKALKANKFRDQQLAAGTE